MQKIKITLAVICLFWASLALAGSKSGLSKNESHIKKQKVKPKLLHNYRIRFSNYDGQTRFIYVANQLADGKKYFTIALEDEKNRLVMVAAPLKQRSQILTLLKKSKELKSKGLKSFEVKIGKFKGLLNSVFHIKLFKMNNKYIPVLTLSESVKNKSKKAQVLEVSCFLSDQSLNRLLDIFEYKLAQSKALVKK